MAADHAPWPAAGRDDCPVTLPVTRLLRAGPPVLVGLMALLVLVLAGPASAAPAPLAAAALPLAGKVVAIDPGHQLGNSRHLAQINRPVWVGLRKPCNTTGTATNGGYPEATFTWQVSLALRDRLRALGATVRMTRSANSPRLWGPCVDVRGELGARV